MHGIRKLTPTPATVIALIALFASLGGVSYGLATNSVDSRELKNNSVSSRDVRNNSLTGQDVRNGSLQLGDFAAGQAPQGPQGPPGQPGTPGQNGFGLLSYPFASDTFGATEAIDIAVGCPDGTFPTGGDAIAVDTNGPGPDDDEVDAELALAEGLAFDDGGNPAGWFASGPGHATEARAVIVEVVCANASTIDAEEAGGASGRSLRRVR